VAGFAPLVAGGLRPRRLATVLETLRSPTFIGYPGLRRSLPPSTSPEDTGFNSRSYWRGPVWPVIDWLLWWAFVRAGEHQLAERVRESSLEQIAEGGFAEYFEPFTGEPLGSREQSWTAAVALDWLAHGPQREMRAA
jgi:glycogen debranching enzyme